MSEMIVIGIVALIFIGPRDLPEMFRQLGRMSAKMRGMAREFSRAMEQAAKETGVQDIARDLNTVANPKAAGLNAVKGAMDKFEKWDPIKNAAKPAVPAATVAKPLVPPPMPAPPVAATPVPATPAAPEAATSDLLDDPLALLEDEDESLLEDLLDAPEAAAPPAVGSHTAELQAKMAARGAILRESAEKLKALEAAPAPVVAPVPAAEPSSLQSVAAIAAAKAAANPVQAPTPEAAPKPRRKSSAAPKVEAEAPAPKAKAPRKAKSEPEAAAEPKAPRSRKKKAAEE